MSLAYVVLMTVMKHTIGILEGGPNSGLASYKYLLRTRALYVLVYLHSSVLGYLGTCLGTPSPRLARS